MLFYSSFLRQAVWVAPPEWIEAKMRYLDDQNLERFHTSEFQHELTSQLIGYVKGRKHFIERGELAQRIDRAIHDYCWLPPNESRHSIVECQSYLALHADEVLELFSSTDAHLVQLTRTWLWLSDECLEQSPLGIEQTEFNGYVNATLKLLGAIDQLFPKSVLENYQQLRHSIGAFLVVAGIVAYALTQEYARAYWYATLAIQLVILIAYTRWFRPKYIDPWFEAYIGKLIRKHYHAWWRGLICRFFAATHLDFHLARRAIDFNLQRRTNRFGTSTWLPHLLPEDLGVQIFASAVRFLR